MKKKMNSDSLYKQDENRYFLNSLNTRLGFKQIIVIFSILFLFVFFILKNNMALIFILFILIILIFLFKFLFTFVKSLKLSPYEKSDKDDFQINFQNSITRQYNYDNEEVYSLNDLSKNQNNGDEM